MRYLGIDNATFSALVESRVLTAYYLNGRGRAWFKREEVLEAERSERIFRTDREPITQS